MCSSLILLSLLKRLESFMPSNFQHYKIVFVLIAIQLSLPANANSLRDRKGPQFQTEVTNFDLHASNFLRAVASSYLGISLAIGDATPIFKDLRNKAIAYWRTTEPRDFKNISLLYDPYCLAQVPFLDLRRLNFTERRNGIFNSVETNFQKFGAIETPDFFRLVESSRVLQNNLNTLNSSLDIIPFINGQFDYLKNYISKIESTQLHLLNQVSTQLTNSANLSESINSLYTLKTSLSDSTEIDIIDKFIVLMTALNKLPIQTEESLKALQGNAPAVAVISQIDFYKSTVNNWQIKLQNSYDETKGVLNKLDSDIVYARTQMVEAEAAVNVGITAIASLEAEADSKIRDNFQKTNARVNDIVTEWHAYKESMNKPIYSLWVSKLQVYHK